MEVDEDSFLPPPATLAELAAGLAQLQALVEGLSKTVDERFESVGRRLARIERQLGSAGGLRVGDLVRIDGLDNEAHLRLNGKKARLLRWDGPGGRWQVQVLQTGEVKSLKRENLAVVPGASCDGEHAEEQGATSSAVLPQRDGGGGLSVGDIVELQGLRRAASLNGERAEILAWDDTGGRWMVRLRSSGLRKCLRTGNLRRIGERVRLPVREESRSAQIDTLEPGVVVRLQFLQAAGLNGLTGRVMRKDGQAGRWVVQLLESREEKSFRTDNLVEEPGCVRAGQVVRIAGLEQAEHLNGLRGEVLRWVADRGRWAVNVLEVGEEKFLRPESLSQVVGGDLRPRQLAVIHGLEQAEELNGRSAMLVQWAAAEGRWLVKVQGSGEEKRLRPRRLRASGADPAAADQSEAPVAPPPDATDTSRAAGRAATAASGTTPMAEDDAVEVLGDSGDEAEEAVMTDGPATGQDLADVLRDGAEVVITGGSHIGRRGTLLQWEDVGGPFGQWVVRMQEPGNEPTMVHLHPGVLALAGT